MAIVMVHGYPATACLWNPVIDALGPVDEQIIALDLPGFAEPPPEAWSATKECYVDWLIQQFAAIASDAGPVNVVAHDWGCLLSLRAAMLRPDLIRTIVAGNGPIDEHYPLHDTWQTWAQPGLGEEMMAQMTPEFLHENLTDMIPAPYMDTVCALLNPWNRDVGLALYRSGVSVGSEWAADLPKIIAPSMILWGEQDMNVPVHFGRRMAARIGAEFVTVPGKHFWQLQCPEEGAAHLKRFWKQFEDYTVPNSILHDSTM